MLNPLVSWYENWLTEKIREYGSHKAFITEVTNKGIENYLSPEEICELYTKFPDGVWEIVQEDMEELDCGGIGSYLSACYREPKTRAEFEFMMALLALEILLRRELLTVEARSDYFDSVFMQARKKKR